MEWTWKRKNKAHIGDVELFIGKVGGRVEFERINALSPPPPTENMVEIKVEGGSSGQESAI